MSTDALVATWKWNFGSGWVAGITAETNFTMGFPSEDGGSNQFTVNILLTSTLAGSPAVMTPKINFKVSSYLAGAGAGTDYTFGGTTFPAYTPDLNFRLTMYRNMPAGVGKSRFVLDVDTLDQGTETVQEAASITIDREGLWAQKSFISGWYHTKDRASNITLTAPWPVDPVDSDPVFWSPPYPSNVESVIRTGAVITDPTPSAIGLAPPFERGLVVNCPATEQMISRRDISDGGYGQVKAWARVNHAASWVEAGGALANPTHYRRGAMMAIDGRLTMRLHGFSKGGATAVGERTFDRGETWAAAIAPFPGNAGTASQDNQRPRTDIAFDPRDGSSCVVGLDWNDTADRIWAYRGGVSTVIANCRSAGETDCLPHPHCYRRPDGRWAVAWFVNDAPREYVSGDGGATWEDDSPTEDWTAGAGAAYYTAFWQGLDGQQVVAGYHFGDEEFVVLSRLGPAHPWTGPYLQVASAVAAAPYVYQRSTGAWEAGWLVAGAWTLYTANWPSETWTEVTP